MGDIGITTDSLTTLDVTASPPDELCMTFTAAASASNTSSNFVAQTKGPDLFGLPLSAGIAVAGELMDDPSTITAPFLPGDIILACLIPPKPCLLSAHEGSLRLRIPTISALELPSSMSPEAGCSYFTTLMTGAAILKEQLRIPITRTPTASPTVAEDGGVESYNRKPILVVGGETELGAALVQLLHRALPAARIHVTSTTTKSADLSRRLFHLQGLGAANAIDAATDNSSDQLSPSFDIIINASRDQPAREEIMSLLDGMQKIIECGSLDVEKGVKDFLEEEPDCVTSLHEMLLQAAGVFEREPAEEELATGELAKREIKEPVSPKEKLELQREDSGTVVE